MAIVMISESLLERATASDGRILRDRVLCGFGVRLNARKRTFLIATSVCGKQFRMMLGHWPLMTVDDARSKAMEVLRQCRNGERPSRKVRTDVPVLQVALLAYCKAKGLKASSQKRYDSIFRTHFGDWLERSVTDLSFGEFSEHCHAFAQSKGNAMVEVGRGVVQLQTKGLRGGAVHDRAKEVQNKYQRIDKKLILCQLQAIIVAVNTWCEVDPRVKPHREKYIAHAQARALLTVTTPTWKGIAELGGLIQGIPPLGAKTVRDGLHNPRQSES